MDSNNNANVTWIFTAKLRSPPAYVTRFVKFDPNVTRISCHFLFTENNFSKLPFFACVQFRVLSYFNLLL